METIDDLFKGPDPIISDQLTGPLLNSVPLLGTDVWQEAINKFDEFAETEANADLPMEQQQYLSDLRVDRYLCDVLTHECGLLEIWQRENPEHPEAALGIRHCPSSNGWKKANHPGWRKCPGMV